MMEQPKLTKFEFKIAMLGWAIGCMLFILAMYVSLKSSFAFD